MTDSKNTQAQENAHGNANEGPNAPPLRDLPPTETDGPPSPPEHNDRNTDSEDVPWWRDRHFIVQVAIFLVTIVIAGIYGRQLEQMIESNRINRESLQSVQRAVVNFAGINQGVAIVSEDRKHKNGQVILIVWNNTGNTPAKKAVAMGNFQSWRGELPSSYDFHDIAKFTKDTYSQETLGPHQNLQQQIAIPIDNFRSQRAGTDRMFFYGWIVYRDVFSGTPDRLTEFCAEMIEVSIDLTKDIADPTNYLNWNVQSCRQHNCYDEDCADYSERINSARFPKD